MRKQEACERDWILETQVPSPKSQVSGLRSQVSGLRFYGFPPAAWNPRHSHLAHEAHMAHQESRHSRRALPNYTSAPMPT
jgi:hypothetical protein